MKRKVGKFPRSEALLPVGIIAILAGALWVWKYINTSMRPATLLMAPTEMPGFATSRRNVQFDRSSTPSVPLDDTSAAEDFGDHTTWPYFDESYQSLYRRFRFRYPPMFEIRNFESDLVWLKKGNEYYLGIDKYAYLDVAQNSTPDKTFEFHYAYRKSINSRFPDLTTVEKIELGNNILLYKFIENKENYLWGSTSLFDPPDTWNRYLGVIEGHGIDIFDLKKLPEDVVYEIIWSIEFKQHE